MYRGWHNLDMPRLLINAVVAGVITTTAYGGYLSIKESTTQVVNNINTENVQAYVDAFEEVNGYVPLMQGTNYIDFKALGSVNNKNIRAVYINGVIFIK